MAKYKSIYFKKMHLEFLLLSSLRSLRIKMLFQFSYILISLTLISIIIYIFPLNKTSKMFKFKFCRLTLRFSEHTTTHLELSE